MAVTLQEITASSVRSITDLQVSEAQEKFVASNAVSLAEALFSEETWYRAIYRESELIGFVMLYDESLRKAPKAEPQIAIWRFMIDKTFQHRGYGRQALELIIKYVKSKTLFSSLLVSYVPGPDSPEEFYLKSGFEHTGMKDEDGEIILKLSW